MKLLIYVILMVFAVLLEMYLSRKPSRWPGLVLPGLALLLSLIYPLSMAALGQDAGMLAAQMIIVCLIANIPTIILLRVYLVARRSVKRMSEYEKMRAQDL